MCSISMGTVNDDNIIIGKYTQQFHPNASPSYHKNAFSFSDSGYSLVHVYCHVCVRACNLYLEKICIFKL